MCAGLAVPGRVIAQLKLKLYVKCEMVGVSSYFIML